VKFKLLAGEKSKSAIISLMAGLIDKDLGIHQT